MFKKFSIALLLVVATPVLGHEGHKDAAATPAAPAAVVVAAATPAPAADAVVAATAPAADAAVAAPAPAAPTAPSKTLMTRAKDLAVKSKDALVGAPAVAMALVSEYKWTSAALGAVATAVLLYNYNDDFKSMVRGMVGCSDNEECPSFCAKRK